MNGVESLIFLCFYTILKFKQLKVTFKKQNRTVQKDKRAVFKWRLETSSSALKNEPLWRRCPEMLTVQIHLMLMLSPPAHFPCGRVSCRRLSTVCSLEKSWGTFQSCRGHAPCGPWQTSLTSCFYSAASSLSFLSKVRMNMACSSQYNERIFHPGQLGYAILTPLQTGLAGKAWRKLRAVCRVAA